MTVPTARQVPLRGGTAPVVLSGRWSESVRTATARLDIPVIRLEFKGDAGSRLDVIDVDWRIHEVDGATLVAAVVENEAPTPRRVSLVSRLDGAVQAPRRRGLPERGWSDDGFEGVVPAESRLALGFASRADPVEPPVEVVDEERATEAGAPTDDGGDPTPTALLRVLGSPAPPRDAVSPVGTGAGRPDRPTSRERGEVSDDRGDPTPDQLEPSGARAKQFADHSDRTAHHPDSTADRSDSTANRSGSSGERPGSSANPSRRTLGGSEPPADRTRNPIGRSGPDENGSREATGPEAAAPEQGTDPVGDSDGGDTVPEPLAAWFDDVRARRDRVERLADARSLEDAASAIQDAGGLADVERLLADLAADEAALQAVAERAAALAGSCAVREDVPVDAYRRLA